MTNPLDKLSQTIGLGVIIALSLAVAAKGLALDYAWWTFFFRWLHVRSGVMWLG